jgi:hypothetical protein
VRANKKKGLKSKKELREQVRLFNYIVALYIRIQRRMNQIQDEAKERLKEIAIRHGYVVGKWCVFLFLPRPSPLGVYGSPCRLIFAPSDRVDVTWATLARVSHALFAPSMRSLCLHFY